MKPTARYTPGRGWHDPDEDSYFNVTYVARYTPETVSRRLLMDKIAEESRALDNLAYGLVTIATVAEAVKHP